MKKVLLIDGSNLIFRAYFATEKNMMTSPDGRPVNAIHGVANMLLKIIKDENPDYLYIALDQGKATFRHKLLADYKGKRNETPPSLKSQFPLVKEMYDAMGVKHFAIEEYEADDLIATYAIIAEKKGYHVKVISGDKDLLQLVSPNITVMTPKIGFSKEINYTPTVFQERYTFDVSRFIEYKSLVGDASDNIIGVPKVGDKTATKFINTYSSLEDLKANAENIKGVVGENLRSNFDRVYENMHLVELVKDIDGLDDLETLKFDDFNYETLIPFYRSLGFKSIVSKFEGKQNLEATSQKIDVNIIKHFSIAEHTAETTFIYAQALTENYHVSELLGFGISSKNGDFFLNIAQINDEFKSFLQNKQLNKITYNLKQLIILLRRHEITEIAGFSNDLMLAIAIINPTHYKLDFQEQFEGYGVTDLYS